MSSVMSEHAHIEVDTGSQVQALKFTANSEYLVSGGEGGIQIWRVRDGKRVATMQLAVCSVAVSNDGKYIAASSTGSVSVWDATTYEQVLLAKLNDGEWLIEDVGDFSPDSTQLVSANGVGHRTATIWDLATRQRIQTLDHREAVYTAKYSPQGNRIVTGSKESIRIWDSGSAHLLVDIRVAGLRPRQGLLWFNHHLFIKTNDGRVKRINASTGLTVSEWPVPSSSDDHSSISLPQHGKFMAYSERDSITFQDTSTHTQLSTILRGGESRAIAFSADGQLLAVVARGQNIIIKDLSLIEELDTRIGDTMLDAWKHGRLADAEALLTTEIPVSKDTTHHVLAGRAIVRARLRQWDAALIDAEESIKIQSSAIGYIAKCVVLAGRGDTLAGCRVCDIGFQLHSDRATILLLVKAVVLFLAGEHNDAISRIEDLIPAAYYDSTFYVVQAYMHLLLGNSHMRSGNYERAIQSFKLAQVKLGTRTHPPPLIIPLISGWEFDDLAITIQQQSCEALFAMGRINEAGASAQRMVARKINISGSIKTWVSDFMQRCLSTPQNDCNMIPLLREWAKLRLTIGSWKDALGAAADFILPRLTVYQVVCERLEMTDRVPAAVACFHQMRSELPEVDGVQANWIRDFESRCPTKLESNEAVSLTMSTRSLNPTTLLAPRGKTNSREGGVVESLNDANRAIELNPSSPSGYKRMHAALHNMGRHHDAIRAYETMLLKMSESSDPVVRERFHRYVRPEKTRETIRATIEDTIRDSPLVLINTMSGRLCNKSEQASAFKATSTFTELVSSMTTHIDKARIELEVGKYFRYATFSHRWEDNEPLFEKVVRIVVYDLEASPTHEKLQMFCKIVREAGFNWAWSDTCCINKADHFVLQEALVSMFGWYERSAMTLIFLRGVDRRAKPGALTRSIWNMRAWTLQEYHASKVVRIYTEDWTPYLGLSMYNHKDSPQIISEMEEATGISASTLIALRPGLDDIRTKLSLASKRQTTRAEDAAYSLLGIFSLSLPVVYGEGDKALGRLLVQLLASSGDASIFAWTGRSGSFNSCLPAKISVYSQPATSHIPPPISDARMQEITAGLRSLDLPLAARLYDRLHALPVPFMAGRRIKLPCLAFKLGRVLLFPEEEPVCTFRAQTDVLGVVEIRTTEDLSQYRSLYLVHPWTEFLLDRQPFPDSSTTHVATSLHPPSTQSTDEKSLRVLQFIARLGQPFGALLLTKTRRNMEEYRRVATESEIRVQVKEVALDRLIHTVCMLDVL